MEAMAVKSSAGSEAGLLIACSVIALCSCLGLATEYSSLTGPNFGAAADGEAADVEVSSGATWYSAKAGKFGGKDAWPGAVS